MPVKKKKKVIKKDESPFTYELTKNPDELKFVDHDIAEEFAFKQYFVGTPTMVQLSRDIKKLASNFKDFMYE